MIFANGKILPDAALDEVLASLEENINAARMGPPLEPETVIAAVDTLGRRLAAGEFAPLLAQYLPAGMTLTELLPMLRRETLETKLRAELGDAPFGPRTFSDTTARVLPLAICPACRYTPLWRACSPAT